MDAGHLPPPPARHVLFPSWAGGGSMRLSVARRVTFAVILGLGVRAVAAHAQVTVSGLGYANYTYQLKSDTTLSPAANQNNFDVTRAYITATGKFADGVGARITADIA